MSQNHLNIYLGIGYPRGRVVAKYPGSIVNSVPPTMSLSTFFMVYKFEHLHVDVWIWESSQTYLDIYLGIGGLPGDKLTG